MHLQAGGSELDDPSPIELSFLLPRQSMGIDIIKEIEKIEDLELGAPKHRPSSFKTTPHNEALYSTLSAYDSAHNNTARYKT